MAIEVTMREIPGCDFCRLAGDEDSPAAFDGKTRRGPWAYMCTRHWDEQGIGRLGTGYGQALIQSK